TDSFHLNRDTNNIKLAISKPIVKDFRLIDRKIQKNGTINFIFNKPLNNPSINILVPENLNQNKLINYSLKNDSASLWLPDMAFDSLKVELAENKKPLDTIVIRRSKNEKYDRDLIITDNLNSQKVNKINHIILNSTAPIKSANKANIILTEDSIPRTNFQLFPDSTNNQKYIIRYAWRAKRNYELELKDEAFLGFFGEKSKIVKRKFTLDETENFGDIILQVNTPDTIGNQYLVQITNEKKDIIYESRSITKSERLIYKQFPGGKYTIRIVYDINRNKQWDPADVQNKRQPEKVWYHSKTVTVRPNWEQEELIDIPQIDTPTK
ncbi:MAG TPA: hypothetical protein VN040_20105, partial [Pseudosphingobacterium sp.]|nr:hypothetical protein [Pseudosphingobacterium sp.]